MILDPLITKYRESLFLAGSLCVLLSWSLSNVFEKMYSNTVSSVETPFEQQDSDVKLNDIFVGMKDLQSKIGLISMKEAVQSDPNARSTDPGRMAEFIKKYQEELANFDTLRWHMKSGLNQCESYKRALTYLDMNLNTIEEISGYCTKLDMLIEDLQQNKEIIISKIEALSTPYSQSQVDEVFIYINKGYDIQGRQFYGEYAGMVNAMISGADEIKSRLDSAKFWRDISFNGGIILYLLGSSILWTTTFISNRIKR